ncbi:hypothetical protein HYV12_02580 [Candidatus Dojkabacteria bacterium]|nr:hypothetical protein [Candidatus Dojkabacteria bacterium]
MSNIKINALILLMFSLLAKAMAFGREILLAYFFGAGLLLDAFNSGIAFSNSLLFIFSGGAFIPILISFVLESKSESEKRKLNGFLLLLFLLSVIISIATIFLAPYFVGGVNEAIRADVMYVLRVTAFSSTFYALSSIVRAVLNSKGEYKYSGAQDFAMIVVIVVGIIFASKGNALHILSMSFLIASIFRVIVQIPAIITHKEHFSIGFTLDWTSLRQFSLSLFPMVFATLIPQIMIVMTRLISSHLGEGVISGLSYADRTSDLIKSIVAYSLGAVIVAPMAKYIQEGRKDKFMEILNKSLLFSFLISIPLFFLFLLWGREIIQILYQRGSFTAEATTVTGMALSYYSVATLFSSPIFILMSAMYSSKNWKGVISTATVSVLLGVLFMLTTYKSIGIIGVALSVGVYSLTTFILTYWVILRDVGIQYFQLLIPGLMKLFAVNGLTFITSYILYLYSPILVLLAPVLYLIISYKLREPLFLELIKTAMRFLLKRPLDNVAR